MYQVCYLFIYAIFYFRKYWEIKKRWNIKSVTIKIKEWMPMLKSYSRSHKREYWAPELDHRSPQKNVIFLKLFNSKIFKLKQTNYVKTNVFSDSQFGWCDLPTVRIKIPMNNSISKQSTILWVWDPCEIGGSESCNLCSIFTGQGGLKTHLSMPLEQKKTLTTTTANHLIETRKMQQNQPCLAQTWPWVQFSKPNPTHDFSDPTQPNPPLN